jgi:DNA polymerase (family 10)
MLLPEADGTARRAIEHLGLAFPDLSEITVAGRLRRGCQTEESPVLVASSRACRNWNRSQYISPLGVHLNVCDSDHFGIALLFTTGSRRHLRRLQEVARARHLELNETGLWRGPREVLCREEADIYRALDLPFIEPEQRESGGEIDRAMQDRLPELVRAGDIRGALHNHTVYSDGKDTLERMAEAARECGFGFFGLADHFRGAANVHGMSVERALAQCAAIDAINAQSTGLTLLKGVEADIERSGQLDVPLDVLRNLDYLVCSVHHHNDLDSMEQTARVLRAIRNPHVSVLGHLTNRLLPDRESCAMDVGAILQACARHGVVVEINANPRRLDLDWEWHQRALDMGCLFCISPDAHAAAHLDYMRWGVAAARKGGVPKERLLNCMDLADVRHYLRRRAAKLN